jgi:hypothetical protein
MLEHHLQKSIVYSLAFSNGSRFSELKPDDLENKLFDYHLKAVVSGGYVEKGEDGLYRLTTEGRRLGIRAFQKQQETADRAESILFLVIRNKPSGDWLMYRRSIHPLLGKVGFMHAVPKLDLSLSEAANIECLAKTGLKCDFHALGSGYFKTYEGQNLESYVNFTLMVSETAQGELIQNHERAEYFWVSDPDFGAPEMIPNMKVLSDAYSNGKPFFIEQSFHY